MDLHLRYLDECAELHETRGKNSHAGKTSDPLERLHAVNPDLMLEIAKVKHLLLTITAASLFSCYWCIFAG